MPSASFPDGTSLGTLARLFLKLGVIAFGGPAAHIAMLEDEVVERRGWLSRQHFLDLMGATNLIPGPNSTEMVMHVGYERGGWRGMLVAGACFILPAAVITGTLGWLYVRYGTLPEVTPFLAGVKPVVLAVILGALWRLGRKAVTSWALVPVGVGVAAALVLGLGEVWALLGGGVLGLLWLTGYRRLRNGLTGLQGLLPLGTAPLPLLTTFSSAAPSAEAALWPLGLFFLKVGAVLYGSGYVLVAFLEGGLVQDYGWLTEAQLLDAIAIGQFTPGPVLTTATFIGYVVMGQDSVGLGLQGAAVATVCIFLPSFVFVALLNPIVPRLRASAWSAAFLDAVNVSAVALMLVVTVRIGLSVLTGWGAAALFVLAAVATLRFRLSTAYLVPGGALLGWLLGLS
ncbi:MAG: chromate efflux transporter [Bacteroidetes bacterium]|nr:MAG: chromate efflux transporter [Bacteroidota bacterium]